MAIKILSSFTHNNTEFKEGYATIRGTYCCNKQETSPVTYRIVCSIDYIGMATIPQVWKQAFDIETTDIETTAPVTQLYTAIKALYETTEDI